MDLTENIRAKIDDIRRSKTARYTSTCVTVQDRISKLTQLSANFYSKLEDALEQETTSLKPAKSNSPVSKRDSTEITFQADVNDRSSTGATEIDHEEGHYLDPVPVTYDQYITGNYKQNHHNGEEATVKHFTTNHPESQAIIPTTDSHSKSDVVSLQQDAFATSALLDENRKKLIAIRECYADTLARLDRLENDLTRISKQYEKEEQARLTSSTNSSPISKKRKREDDDTLKHSRKINKVVQMSVGFVAGAAVVGAVTNGHFW
ncbi:hypothetical protein NEOLI_001789 [Neolecta irregularis DAH-3]|uniref:Uncharacterized protein n=1 Tax=Neolecta irregularis (strain DAH-3) TaxID=1198029 RepID=A0A1U7LH52_NEOID|nr:hypothetical protein NEOLI_001789 [Neolecta irregularis DAH-3]|eukprot:OLL21977.1 hypothetical protein NEOLI_001789 [Neolecta irregularis DAH-3]